MLWITIGLMVVGVGLITLAGTLAGYQKGKKNKIDFPILVAGLLGLTFLLPGFFAFWTESCESGTRRRLNEPVVFEAQLYGYQVVDKRYFKNKSSATSPEKSTYLIDIKDLIPVSSVGTLKNVRVSEEIYNKVEKGKSYPMEKVSPPR